MRNEMSVRCCARGRMERREAFQKWRPWRRGKDRLRDECSTLVIIDKTMKRGNILKHSANVWNYTLEFNCTHSTPHCSVKQCPILYVIKQSVREKGSILQIKICLTISASLKLILLWGALWIQIQNNMSSLHGLWENHWNPLNNMFK